MHLSLVESNSWTLLGKTSSSPKEASPMARYLHCCIPSSDEQGFCVYGGMGNGFYLGDFWKFDCRMLMLHSFHIYPFVIFTCIRIEFSHVRVDFLFLYNIVPW